VVVVVVVLKKKRLGVGFHRVVNCQNVG
jgi:hypothetical protein